jgi:hypothetical protein
MLREKSKLAEIAVRMKIGAGQEPFIAEQVEALRRIGEDAFHRDVHRHIHERYEPVLHRANRIAESSKIPILFGDTTKETGNIQRKKDAIIDAFGEDEGANNLTDEMLLFLTMPKETLILLDDISDNQRIFIPDDAEKGEVLGE